MALAAELGRYADTRSFRKGRYLPTTSISPRAFCEALYCGYVEQHCLDLPQRRFVLTVRVEDQDATTRFRAVFEGIILFRWVAPPGAPGDQLELSVVSLDPLDPEKHGAGAAEPITVPCWEAYFNPWYLDELFIRCERITLNGAEVVGKRGHLQTSLPTRVPPVPPFDAGAA